jgi:hypothetical protein
MGRKHKQKKKYKDFVPKDDPGLAVWAANYKEHAKTVYQEDDGIRPAEIDEQETAAQELFDSIYDVFRLKTELAAAVEYKKLVKKKNTANIRRMSMRYKRGKAYDVVKAHLLGILYTGQPLNFDDVVPDIKVKIHLGYVEISFHKQHILFLAVYSRTPGNKEWTFLGNETKSPFKDSRPLKDSKIPERREYMARYTFCGVQLVGQESKIVSVVFGGETSAISKR